MTEGTAHTIMAVCLIVISACCILTVAVVAAAVIFLSRQIKQFTGAIRGLTTDITAIISAVNTVVQAASISAQAIINSVQDTALDIAARVKRTSSLAEETIVPPLTAIGALLTVLTRTIGALFSSAKSDSGQQ